MFNAASLPRPRLLSREEVQDRTLRLRSPSAPVPRASRRVMLAFLLARHVFQDVHTHRWEEFPPSLKWPSPQPHWHQHPAVPFHEAGLIHLPQEISAAISRHALTCSSTPMLYLTALFGPVNLVSQSHKAAQGHYGFGWFRGKQLQQLEYWAASHALPWGTEETSATPWLLAS